MIKKKLNKRIPKKFFNRDPEQVAKDLIGKIIRKKHDDYWLSAQIIETECYYKNEKGSHASQGLTPSRKALFMPAGTIYMYYSRGKDSLNVSCKGVGNAVLIKSGIPYLKDNADDTELKIMQTNNPMADGKTLRPPQKLCSGQALLCKALGLKVIDWNCKQFDRNQFFIADVGYKPAMLINTKRLGISIGRDEHLMYRFIDLQFARTCSKNPLTVQGNRINIDYKLLDVTQLLNFQQNVLN